MILCSHNRQVVPDISAINWRIGIEWLKRFIFSCLSNDFKNILLFSLKQDCIVWNVLKITVFLNENFFWDSMSTFQMKTFWKIQEIFFNYLFIYFWNSMSIFNETLFEIQWVVLANENSFARSNSAFQWKSFCKTW